jgi:hypothetical protein
MGAMGIKYCFVVKSTPNFWDVWGTWAYDTFIRECADVSTFETQRLFEQIY